MNWLNPACKKKEERKKERKKKGDSSRNDLTLSLLLEREYTERQADDTLLLGGKKFAKPDVIGNHGGDATHDATGFLQAWMKRKNT